MESALARQPGGKPAAQRVRWLRGAAVCIALAAPAAGAIWLTPLRNVHLLPSRSDASHVIATAPAGLPRLDNAAPGADTKRAPEAPMPALKTADGEQGIVSRERSEGKPVVPVAATTAAAPPVLLVGRIDDGTQSPRRGEPASQLTGTLDTTALRVPVLPVNATSETAAPPMPAAAAVSPPIDGVPTPRPPLPLETDLITAGAPDADTAAQSGAASPAPPAPPGKPAATDHRG